MMGKVNQERLAEYLGELKRKEDTNDRYVAALRGETLTRKPYVRIQPVSKENISKEADSAPKKWRSGLMDILNNSLVDVL